MLSSLLEFLGSANFAKVLGMLQSGIAGGTAAEGKSLTAHIAGMTVGGVFTIAIHAMDAIRAKIGK